jgi:plasmid maintenance system antidote protein VapI
MLPFRLFSVNRRLALWKRLSLPGDARSARARLQPQAQRKEPRQDRADSLAGGLPAKALGVSRQMLHDILAERRPLSAVMCGSPEVWMRLQAAWDLKKAGQNKKVMERVARIVPVERMEA